MSAHIRFPGNSVLDWYIEAEQMLADFLKYVPYCDAHKEVWSPKLVIILQETCSQLDSLWRWEAAHLHGRKGEVDIRDYFKLYGMSLANRTVLFWAEEVMEVGPFVVWKNAESYSKKECARHPLDWWKEGYQKIKHNRLENRECASLKRTVEALAGLFLAIIHCEKCWQSLWEKHWLSWYEGSGMPFDPLDCLRADFGLLKDEGECQVTYMAVESSLFSYAVGLSSRHIEPKKNCPNWGGNCSHRFKAWYYDYCKEHGT